MLRIVHLWHTQRKFSKQWSATSQRLLCHSIRPRTRRGPLSKLSTRSVKPTQITINCHPRNSMKQFKYLDSISSNDATITKDLDHGLAKASSSFGCLQHRGFWRYITWPSEKSCHQHSSVCCGNLGAVRKTHTAAGTLPPKLPVIHHGNTLAGLCHQRRSSREG